MRGSPVYNSYFGFSESPFLSNHKYSFLFLNNESEEILASLIEFIKQKNGSAVVYGDHGCGKTMLLKCLMRRLPKSVQPIMANPLAGPMEIMHDIAKSFNITIPQRGFFYFPKLEEALIAEGRQRKYFLLIVDDAHLLDDKALDTIWLFSNIERHDQNLIKILLIGQPELSDKLKRLELINIPQFIALEHRLSPLNAVDTIKYVSHRLRKVGSGISTCFEPNCMHMIFELTGGVPERINQVCNAALTACVELNLKKVNRKILKRLARPRRREGAFAHSTYGFGKPWLPVIMSLVIIIIISLWGVKRLSPTKLNQTAQQSLPVASDLKEVRPAPAPEVPKVEETSRPQDAAVKESTGAGEAPTPQPTLKQKPAASTPPAVASPANAPASQPSPAPEVGKVQQDSGFSGLEATVYTVTPQDKNLTSIVANHYLGNKKIGVEAVILANPSLSSENLIHPSERILLPRVAPDRSIIILNDNLLYAPYGRYQPSPSLQQDLDRFKKLQVRYVLRKTEDANKRGLYWIFLGGYEKEAQLIEARRSLTRR
jgi:type II secretory pathway predicted ATPase ExeA